MEFALALDGTQYEVTLHGAHPGLTVADAFALYGDRAGFVVDGRPVAADARFLDTVAPGTVVAVGGDTNGERIAESGSPRRRAVNRPPRSEFPVALPPLPAPSARSGPSSTFRFGWAALIVPVVLGIVLAVVIHPRMALFAVFSPAMALANWIEQRRRSKYGIRRATEETSAELADFRSRLATAVRAEVRLRRRSHPPIDQLISWAMDLDGRLWERRTHHDDAMSLALGVACTGWAPELTSGYNGPAPEVHDAIRHVGVLHDVPVAVSLAPGSVVGVAGGAAVRSAVARSLLIQAATLHGPSDLRLAVATDDPDRWDWCKWLPHVVADADLGRRRLAGTHEEYADLAMDFVPERFELGETRRLNHTWDLLVVDVADLTHPSLAAVREAIDRAAGGGGAVLTLAPSLGSLSSRCQTVVELDDSGVASIRTPSEARAVRDVAAWVATRRDARRMARRLARVIDPDLSAAAAQIPSTVRLVELLGMESPTPNAVAKRWARHTGSDPAGPVGASADGVFSVSLVADGPHALLAGTTGSGKSEFLRSLVASLAASTHPDELTFVLVDYKGGSAFDVCARLPHTVGLVTDLDGHLAQRALTCLEAELRYREEQLRAVGAADLPAYRDTAADEPLPRLLVVVDEFAALAKELPDFMASLIDVAQRGRSLGVHLLLATQRPQGVINDQIRANTNLRIALRVQDPADSVDVLGVRTAAAIGRAQTGRGYVRLGAGDVVGFQAALVTGPATGRPDPELVPFVFASEQPRPSAAQVERGQPTDLEMLVDAVSGAFEQTAAAAPRRPWLEPLGSDLLIADLAPPPTAGVPLGLADEPSRQRQRVATWQPADGNLLLYGVAGSGTSTAIVTLAVGLAKSCLPDGLHLYALDFDDQLLAPLEGLGHCGGIVGPADRERQVRLIRMLQKEIDRRRLSLATNPSALADLATIVLLVDNYGGFAAAFDDPSDLAVKSALARVIADGPGVGVVSIVAAKQPVDVPAQVSSLIPAKLLFKLADRYEYAGQGLSGVDPPTVPGRCYESWTGREVQIAQAHPDGAGAAVALVEGPLAVDRPVPMVGVLPSEVKISQVTGAASVFDLEWVLPVGIGDQDLLPVGFRLGEGDHVVISGPARSGKSTALATLAAVAKAARPELQVVAVAPRRSPLADCPDVDVVAPTAEPVADWLDQHDALLILVDDAAMVDDVGGCLGELADRPRSGVHVVAAAPGDLLRSAYGHWTAGMRRSRIGLALKPSPATDGDLWQTPLPRRGPTQIAAGRGYLIGDGACELIQVAGT
jgi:S-DNA-T family DNA segregation ATPase FtsK/SpoIIIE